MLSLEGVRAHAVTSCPLASADETQRAPVPREAPMTMIFMRASYVKVLAPRDQSTITAPLGPTRTSGSGGVCSTGRVW